MNNNLRLFAGIAAGVAVLPAVFTVVASFATLYFSHATEFFVFPYAQWWGLVYKYWGHWTPIWSWMKILTGGIFGLMIPILVLKMVRQRYFSSRGPQNQFWRPQMDQREWRRPPLPPIIGGSPNHGIARFASEDEQRQRFPEP